MSPAHWHLVLNHFPIITPIIGFLVLASGYYLRSDLIKRTAFSIFILGALCAIPAFLSGEGAEEVVEKLQGIEEKYMETHEETGKIFLILSSILGGLSLIGLWANWKQKPFATTLTFVVALFSLGVVFFAQKTGTTGGEIRHTEIRGNSTAPTSIEHNNKADDDDD